MKARSSTEWATPRQFFDALDREFHFTLDSCANADNAKCTRFYTAHDDGLDRDWSKDIVWMNPPYNRDVWKWCRKAFTEAQRGATVVCLLQSRSTDSKMWHQYIMRSSELRFVQDRLHFSLNGISARANISSVVVVFRPFCEGVPVVSSIDKNGRR